MDVDDTLIPRCAAIIPAAGQAARMGAFKPLLPIDGHPLIRLTVACAIDANVSNVIVICGPRSAAIQQALKGVGDPLHNLHFAHNPHYAHQDMLASIKIGLKTLHSYDKDGSFAAVFITPGDMPAIRPSTYSQLLDHWIQSGAQVSIPRFKGQQGHPLLLARQGIDQVLAYTGQGGLRQAVSGLALGYVDTDDAGILMDVDTPQDYQDLIAYLPQANS